jgi:aldehyde dehydrogenase (NAD+)
MKNWAKPIQCDTPMLLAPGRSYIVPEPLGVTAVLGSWNHAFYTW